MKTLKFILLIIASFLAMLTFNSCLDDDSDSLDDIWIGMATARPLSENTFYLTLNDSTTLWPAAPTYINFQPTRPQRVLLNFTRLGTVEGYDYAIRINRIDTILTKEIAENLADRNDEVYGTDPVEITSLGVGDGFLNIEFKAYFSGDQNRKHFVNLIPLDESGDAYSLEFRHHAKGDQASMLTTGFVAFDLSSLPSTGGKDVALRVKVTTFGGVEVFEKKYNSSKNTESNQD